MRPRFGFGLGCETADGVKILIRGVYGRVFGRGAALAFFVALTAGLAVVLGGCCCHRLLSVCHLYHPSWLLDGRFCLHLVLCWGRMACGLRVRVPCCCPEGRFSEIMWQ